MWRSSQSGLFLEEVSWCQKSSELWLKKGDINIAFSHKMDNSHRRRNSLSRIRIGDIWMEGEENIRGNIANALKDLSDLGVWQANVHGLPFSVLDIVEASDLEDNFSESEVLLP